MKIGLKGFVCIINHHYIVLEVIITKVPMIFILATFSSHSLIRSLTTISK